jgi:uroporphyrinogen-III synthase
MQSKQTAQAKPQAKTQAAAKPAPAAASAAKPAKPMPGAVPKVKSILITHAASPDGNSPYSHIATAWNIKVDHVNFIEIAGVPTPEFRKQNIHPLDYTAIVFTSKHTIDHFFRICKDLRIEMPAEVKYFCVTDATAKYLQKYITIRKRKLFVGERSTSDLIALVKKHASEKFLIPSGEATKSDLTDFMHKQGYVAKEAMVYQTVFCDLGKLKMDAYEMICFFSPQSVASLFHNFPKFAQKKTLVAVFGKSTAKAATDAGLRVDIEVPQPDMPSMAMAIEHYLSH